MVKQVLQYMCFIVCVCVCAVILWSTNKESIDLRQQRKLYFSKIFNKEIVQGILASFLSSEDGIKLWFSNFGMHQHPLQGLLDCSTEADTQEIWFHGIPGIRPENVWLFNRFSGIDPVAGLRTKFWKLVKAWLRTVSPEDIIFHFYPLLPGGFTLGLNLITHQACNVDSQNTESLLERGRFLQQDSSVN